MTLKPGPLGKLAKLANRLETRRLAESVSEATSVETRRQMVKCAEALLDLLESRVGESPRGRYLATEGRLEAVAFCINKSYRGGARIRVARLLDDNPNQPDQWYSLAYSTQNRTLDCEVTFQSGGQPDVGPDQPSSHPVYFTRAGRYDRLHVSENQAQNILTDLQTLIGPAHH